MDYPRTQFSTKKNRVTKTKELFSVLEKSKHQEWRDIITGDQLWFGFYYEYDGKWCLPKEKKNTVMNGSKIQLKKVMVTIIWGVNGIYIDDFLPYGESYNSEYFVEHILNMLHEIKVDLWGGSDVKKISVTS